MDNLIFFSKLDVPVNNEYIYPNGEIIKWESAHEYCCSNKNVEKVWYTGSVNETEFKINLHLIMKDGTMKDFCGFNSNGDYTIVQDWLTENNY